MFKIALSGQMFDSLSVWDHLVAAADCGYDSIELRSTHIFPNTDEAIRKAVLEYLDKRSLRVSCISCFVGNYGLSSEEDCREVFRSFCAWLDLAAEFRSPMIRLWPAWVESASAESDVYEKAARWVRLSAEEAVSRNVRIAMEMHHGTILDTAESSLRLLDGIGMDNVGLILDPVNLYQVPVTDIGKCVRSLGPHIFDVHIKDIILLSSPAHKGCFRYDYYAEHIGKFTRVIPPAKQRNDFYAHRRIGMGGVDWPAILEALTEIGYNGPLAVESVSEADGYMPSGRKLAEACMQDVRLLLSHLPASPVL